MVADRTDENGDRNQPESKKVATANYSAPHQRHVQPGLVGRRGEVREVERTYIKVIRTRSKEEGCLGLSGARDGNEGFRSFGTGGCCCHCVVVVEQECCRHFE